MSALVYLLRTRIKNRLISLLKSPGSVIGIILMAALLVMLVVTGSHGGEADIQAYRDISELYAGILLLFAMLFVIQAKNGLEKGSSLFSMQDVNLLFTSPLSNRRILVYGLLQQMGTSLLMGLFLLFQYGWMRNVYGVNFGFLLGVVLGYGITVFCGQLTAMVIYVNTVGSPARKRATQWTMVGVCVLAAGYLLYHAYAGRTDILGSVVAAAQGLPLAAFPVAGWAAMLIRGIAEGNILLIIGMLALCAAYIVLITRWMTSSQQDYYEDVLQATERSFTAITASKEGKASESLPTQVKVGKTGLGGGWGPSAFFYKQKLESRRARRFILDPMSLIMLAASLAFAFFLRGEDSLLGVFVFVTYMQFFTVSTGRWVRELLLPYVYMAPGSSFQKLLYCLVESLKKIAVEAVLMAVGMMLILGLSPVETIAFALARISFGMLFTAGMIVVERLFTGITLKWLVMIVMVVTELLVAIPGIVFAVWISVIAPDFLTANLRMLLLPAVINIPVSFLLVFASRNVLRTAELNNQ